MSLVLTAQGDDSASVRLWLLGAGPLQTAYSPLMDAGTLVNGARFVRPAGSGLVTISVSGVWSPDEPLAAAGEGNSLLSYPHEDMDRLAQWLAEGSRMLTVEQANAKIGDGALAGGGINIRRQWPDGNARVIDWSVAINMAAGLGAVWQGNRPTRPTPLDPDVG